MTTFWGDVLLHAGEGFRLMYKHEKWLGPTDDVILRLCRDHNVLVDEMEKRIRKEGLFNLRAEAQCEMCSHWHLVEQIDDLVGADLLGHGHTQYLLDKVEEWFQRRRKQAAEGPKSTTSI